MAYNNETIIAEKLETVISRNVDNTRMKDYYDLHMFVHEFWQEIDVQTLMVAIENTSRRRGSIDMLNNAFDYIRIIEQDSEIKKLWTDYQKKYIYASEISFEDIIASLKLICKLAILSTVEI